MPMPISATAQYGTNCRIYVLPAVLRASTMSGFPSLTPDYSRDPYGKHYRRT